MWRFPNQVQLSLLWNLRQIYMYHSLHQVLFVRSWRDRSLGTVYLDVSDDGDVPSIFLKNRYKYKFVKYIHICACSLCIWSMEYRCNLVTSILDVLCRISLSSQFSANCSGTVRWIRLAAASQVWRIIEVFSDVSGTSLDRGKACWEPGTLFLLLWLSQNEG